MPTSLLSKYRRIASAVQLQLQCYDEFRKIPSNSEQ